WRNERRLREVHLGRNGLHPVVVARRLEQADGSGVAMKRAVGERVDLEEWNHHGSSSITASTSISTRWAGSMRRLTSTMVAAGRTSRKHSPCARPTSSHREMSVTNIRVRTT